MNQSNAAGRKAEKQPNAFEHHMEALLDMATDGMREAMQRAETAEIAYGRPREVNHAVRFGTLGAQLLTALARKEAKREK
jgi:hypothetical protein